MPPVQFARAVTVIPAEVRTAPMPKAPVTYTLPPTENFCAGEVEPTPTLPPVCTTKFSLMLRAPVPVAFPKSTLVANRFVLEAVVAKLVVVVALVDVLLSAVKFWRVVEPFTNKFPRVARPPIMLPVLREVEKRLVLEAVVEKKLVVVALVEVLLSAVKFWRVVEPESNRLESEVRPPVAVKVPVKLAAEEMV
mgnify:CR=1 FL=1